MVRPYQLRQINLQAAEESGENANEHGGEQNIPFGILYLLGQNRDTIKSNKYECRKRSSRGQGAQIKSCGIVDRLQRKKPAERLVEDDVTKSVEPETRR